MGTENSATNGEVLPASAEPSRPAVCVFCPAPLLTITLESTVDGRDQLHLHPGGQGFWVARMATVLGADAVLCAPFGGETGAVLEHLLTQSSIRVRAIPMLEASGSYIHDRRSGQRTELWEADLGIIGRHEFDELYSATLAEGLAAGVCVLAGTHLQEIIEPDTFRRLAGDLASNGIRVIADLSGDALSSALEGGLYLVKMSDEELVRDAFADEDTADAIVDGIGRLLAAGAQNVVVSRAEAGSIACFHGTWYMVRAPSMEVVDHRGAGDSMTAALAVAAARGLATEDTLRLAAAAGALNVTRHGLGSGRADAIEQLAANVDVRRSSVGSLR